MASEGFSNIYDLPDVEMRKTLCDDERRLRLMDRKRRLQAEAAARRAMEQDEMYEKPDEG